MEATATGERDALKTTEGLVQVELEKTRTLLKAREVKDTLLVPMYIVCVCALCLLPYLHLFFATCAN